jgi:hypothetical protein
MIVSRSNLGKIPRKLDAAHGAVDTVYDPILISRAEIRMHRQADDFAGELF